MQYSRINPRFSSSDHCFQSKVPDSTEGGLAYSQFQHTINT